MCPQIDRSKTGNHGLRHELQNLHTVVKEALILGRLGLLDRGPRISASHNLNIPPPFDRWVDYIDLKRTPFALFNPNGSLICDGIFEDCIVTTTERDIHDAVNTLVTTSPNALKVVSDHETDARTLHVPLVLKRDYGTNIQHREAVFAKDMSAYTLRHPPFAPPLRIRMLSSQVLFWLRANGGNSKIVMVHVRRGDKVKISSSSEVSGLAASTAPANILRVLQHIAVPGSATVYIMTNEWDSSHFDALRANYTVFQWNDIPALRHLMVGCPVPDTSAHDTDDTVSGGAVMPADAPAVCDSLTLYSVEEMLMSLVPHLQRVVTFADDIGYRWKDGGLAFLHPVGAWQPPQRGKWCKTIGQECEFHTHCCSGRCRTDGQGKSLRCFDWFPKPVLLDNE